MDYPTARWGNDEIVNRFSGKCTSDYFDSERFLLQRAASFYKNHENFSFLDIGCATGNLIYLLNEIGLNAKYQGIDIEQKMIDIAKEKHKDGHFECINTEYYLENSSMYDCIHCIGVLQHISDPYKVVKQILQKCSLFCVFDVKSWTRNEDIIDLRKSRCGTEKDNLLYNILSETKLEEEIHAHCPGIDTMRISSTCVPNSRVKLTVDDGWRIRNTTYLIRKVI